MMLYTFDVLASMMDMITNPNGPEDSNDSVDGFEELNEDCPFEFNASDSFRSIINVVLAAFFMTVP